MKVIAFLRSLLFFIITILSAVSWSLVCTAAFFLPLKTRCALVTGWTDFVIGTLRIVCGVKYKIEGVENIPKDRNGIILAKHQSTWETYFLPGFFHGPAIILKRELKWLPFFGWALATIEPIAIDRSKKSSAMEQIIRQGKAALDAGRWILMFPEGTRIPYGQIGKYHLGGSRLAVKTGRPILPIAHNAGLYWPKRKFIKKPGTVHMIIGPLIETKDRTPEDVMAEVKDWIEKQMIILDQKYRVAIT